MSEIIFPSEALPEINWNNPNSSALKLSLTNVGGSLNESVNESVINITGGLVVSSKYDYVAVSGSGTGLLFNEVALDDFCIFIKAAITDLSAAKGCMVFGHSTLSTDYVWLRSNASAIRVKAGDIFYEFTDVGWDRDFFAQPNTYAFSRSGNDMLLYINGTYHSTVTANATPLILNSMLDWTYASDYEFTGNFFYSFIFNESKTPEEIQGVTANPYQLHKTQELEREEYALVWGADTGQGVTIPRLDELLITVKYTVGKDCTLNSYDYLISGGRLSYYTGVVGGISTTNIGEIRYNGAVVTEVPRQLYKGDVFEFDYSSTFNLDQTTYIGFRNNLAQSALGLNLASLEFVTDVKNYLWIFDQRSPTTTIADEYQGAIATIVGGATFERIIPKQVFTVGAVGKDYATFRAGYNGENASTYFVEFQIGEFISESSGTTVKEVEWSDFVNGFSVVGTSDDAGFVGSLDLRHSKGTMKNLRLDLTTLYIREAGFPLIENCHITTTITQILAGTLTFKNSRIGTADDSGDCIYVRYAGSRLNLLDCLVESDQLSGRLLNARDGGHIHLVNTIAKVAGTTVAINQTGVDDIITGSNNFANEARIETYGVGTQNAMTDWFDNDGLLTDTAQTTLKGSGWNDSDIGSAFYATALVVTAITGVINSQYSDTVVEISSELGSTIVGTISVDLDNLSEKIIGLIGQPVSGNLDISSQDNIISNVGIIGQSIFGNLDISSQNINVTNIGIIGQDIYGVLSNTTDSLDIFSVGNVGNNITANYNYNLDNVGFTYDTTLGQDINGSSVILLDDIEIIKLGIIGQDILGTYTIDVKDIEVSNYGVIGEIIGNFNLDIQDNNVIYTSYLGSITSSEDDISLSSKFTFGDLNMGSSYSLLDINLTGIL